MYNDVFTEVSHERSQRKDKTINITKKKKKEKKEQEIV
jgi:hypothetical protein